MKIKNNVNKPNLKPAFALLITLSSIIIMMALLAVLMGYLSSAKENSNKTRGLIQSNVMYKDIQILLTTLGKPADVYPLIYRGELPPLELDNNVFLKLDCEPLSNGININWGHQKFETNSTNHFELTHTVLDNVLVEYNVMNTIELKELIYGGVLLDKDLMFREDSSLPEDLFISSKKEFYEILKIYSLENDDFSVMNIPWSKIFVFSVPTKKNKYINGNWTNPELISYLFEIDINTIQEMWIPGTNLKTFIKDYADFYPEYLFSKKEIVSSKCFINYSRDNLNYEFSFENTNKEFVNFEFI